MDGEWERFLHVAKTTLGKDWDVAKDDEQADDHFSHVMHKLNPERYVEPTSWIDSRAGARTGAGTAPHEVIDAIDAMMARNAEGKTLFIVVDEVSQYVHDDDDRMLKLQSFVSALGQKMKGAVWLIATGQQKLDDDAGDSNLGKLKDRFRPAPARPPWHHQHSRRRSQAAAQEEARQRAALARAVSASTAAI